MKRNWEAQRLDVRGFAREGGTLSGVTPLPELARLYAEQTVVLAAEPCPVAWTLTGLVKDLRGGAHQTWLHVQASTRLGLICQRCLEPLDQALAVDRSFRFVSTEQAAEAEDDQSEEDLLVASNAFDALTLIEDELLLELPLVPRHDDCLPPG
jgi:uncharacterized protein